MEDKLKAIVQQVIAQSPTLLAGIPEEGLDYKFSYLEGDLSSIYGEGWEFTLNAQPALLENEIAAGHHRLGIDMYHMPFPYKCIRLLKLGTRDEIEEYLNSPQCEEDIINAIPSLVECLKDV